MKTKEELAEEQANSVHGSYREGAEEKCWKDVRDAFLAGFEAGAEARGGVVLSKEQMKSLKATLLYTVGCIDDKKHTPLSRKTWKDIVQNTIALLDKSGSEGET